ncbi:MAG: DUF2383 domain-containing protein [Candidatus Nitrotoga sp.]
MENKKIVNVLNDLIEISRDDAESFKACAENMEDVELKFFFQTRIYDCEKTIRELETAKSRYGDYPDTEDSIYTLKAYGKVLKEDIPSDLMPLINRGIRRIMIGESNMRIFDQEGST